MQQTLMFSGLVLCLYCAILHVAHILECALCNNANFHNTTIYCIRVKGGLCFNLLFIFLSHVPFIGAAYVS